jgi:threonine dehydrogenase-like Zn-dependent dehydrogenase
MKAVVWHGDENISVDEVDDPRIEEPTDVLVRVTSTAVCGSDLHLYAGKTPGMKDGDIIGHEPMGIVEEVGRDISHVRKGDRVVIPFNISCGSCFMCERDLYSQCETTQNREFKKGASLFGYTHMYGGVPGGQAEYLRVPMGHVGPIKVPLDDRPDEHYLFMSDVLPTAWQAVEYADTPDGGTLAVFGLGPIGLMCVSVAKQAGVQRIIALDHVRERLDAGADRCAEVVDINAVEDIPDQLRVLTDGRGPDSVIDAVGMESEGGFFAQALQYVKLKPDRHGALHDSMWSVRRGGTLSIIGVYGGPDPLFPLGELFDRQIQIRMGQANVWQWIPQILPLLERADDPLGVDSLTTHRLPLEQAQHGYEIFRNKQDGAIKVVLAP